MTPFTYSRAGDTASAVREAAIGGGRYLGGGTNLVDLMREGVERPAALIDVSGLSQSIEELPKGGLRIGAATRNTAVAADLRVRSNYPVLSRALLAGASAQIRNMATVAGNLLQRTRCTYFYDLASRCNKRPPSSGCDALEGFNRYHAILGASSHCVATHPSDLAVALTALDASVELESDEGSRTVPLDGFHLLPGDTPDRETILGPGELITAITIPALPAAGRSTYRKVRDRSSYAFALVSVGAAIAIEDGVIRDVRIALGGVAHRPWRAREAEAALRGVRADVAAFKAAADAELAAARPLRDNEFKIELAKRTLISVLDELAGARP